MHMHFCPPARSGVATRHRANDREGNHPACTSPAFGRGRLGTPGRAAKLYPCAARGAGPLGLLLFQRIVIGGRFAVNGVLGNLCQIHSEISYGEASLPKRGLKTSGAKAEPEEMSLQVAAYLGNLKAMEVLIAAGADVNAVDGSGGTALHRAVRGQKLPMVAFLLESGAKPDGILARYKTPLHYAAERGGIDILQLLLDHNANINAVDEFGWTPLYYAEANGHAPAARLLRQRGAKDRQVPSSERP